MRFLHIADLHIGKTIFGVKLLEDQRYVLNQVLEIIKSNSIGVLFISGDIFDKASPSPEAVKLADWFLSELESRDSVVFAIGGNHDSGERIQYGSSIMAKRGVYMSGVFDGDIKSFSMFDEHGEINVYMLPFIKPAMVRAYYQCKTLDSYEDAVNAVIDALNIDKQKRNVLIAHQFVTGGKICDSEVFSIGGQDNISAEVFDGFDYVALGHLHGPQSVGRPEIRYAGSPLKYSFSEASHEKSATIVDIKEKGNVQISTAPLRPLRDMVDIKGKMEELINREADATNYYRITLRDDDLIIDAKAKLNKVYSNILQLEFDSVRSKIKDANINIENIEKKTPVELFLEFYQKQNNIPVDQKRLEIIIEIFKKLDGEVI